VERDQDLDLLPVDQDLFPDQDLSRDLILSRDLSTPHHGDPRRTVAPRRQARVATTIKA